MYLVQGNCMKKYAIAQISSGIS